MMSGLCVMSALFRHQFVPVILGIACVALPGAALAADLEALKLAEDWVGFAALALFVAAYVLVVMEATT